jgi:hypothetical protein
MQNQTFPFWRRIAAAGIILLLAAGGWLFATGKPALLARAQDGGEQPQRKAVLDVEYTEYTWWLTRYSDNFIVCTLKVEHPGVPNSNEIEGICGKPIAQKWQNSEPCNFAVKKTYDCPGLYFIEREQTQKKRQVEVELPLPGAWLEVAECNPLPGERKCSTQPVLYIRGEEPLPNETILSVQGTVNSEPFVCAGHECRLPIGPTGLDGVNLEFWADSSFGDSSEHYTAKVRLVPWGDFSNPEGESKDPTAWYIDVLSDRWAGGELASCSATWSVFPGLDGPPDWLMSPDTADGLRSETGYYYLAGQLIHAGLVDATSCLDGGLQSANVASACGVEVAKSLLVEWQNRFDQEILDVSRQSGVPARLLKAVFARESQVWPGIFSSYKEAGLGQMTEGGADAVLLWNPDFFHQFCPLVLSKPYCDLGFGNLKAPEQNMLRGALVKQVNAACPGCPAGIDISQANFSVKVFAEGLLGNCEQVGRILRNVTGMDPGQSSSYEDLWRFTLVNYNAGPGCLGTAINRTLSSGEPLDWAHVTARLDPACQGAIGYVEDISGMRQVGPTPTPWLGSAGALPTVVYPRVETTPTERPTGLVRTPTPIPSVSSTPTITATNSISVTPGGPTETPTATDINLFDTPTPIP